MSGRLEGKLALVSGGGSGLGKATAEHLAEEGARVAVTDIDPATAEATADGINASYQGAAIAMRHDVTDAAAWSRVLGDTRDAFGGLDILVNNAGISIHGNTETMTEDNFKTLLDVNVTSVFLGCQAALPLMAETGRASIVNISSVAGKMGNPNTIGYGTTKAGVAYMTKCVALDCAQKGYDVRANSIHPTFIETPLIEQFLKDEADLQRLHDLVPLGRICQPRDVTYAIVFLASDESAMMTGSEVVIDGGLSCGYTPKATSEEK